MRLQSSIILLLFYYYACYVPLFGLDMKLNYGKENKETFAVLNLRNEHPFSCESKLKINGDVEKILCRIVGIPQSGFNPTKSPMLSFNYTMEAKKQDDEKRAMIIEITPEKGVKLQLFSVFSDLKTENPIPVTRQTDSKSYQIVAYYTKIPFLKPDENLEKRDSINFPVSIPKTATPTISELDINRKPLDYIAGKDLDAFLEIRELMNARKYPEALEKIAKALKAYPNSLFVKDMMYYTIVALSHSKSKESQTYLAEVATPWIKAYASDDKIPEVMYLLSKTLLTQNKMKEAYYYLNRTIEEYSHTRYAALSKMQIANTLKSPSDIKRTPLIYREAYKEAQDLEAAGEIAVSWAKFSLRNDDVEYANELLHKVYNVFPAFFLIDKDATMELLSELEEAEQYTMAAPIAEYLSGNVPYNSDLHAKLLNKSSEFYTKIGDFDRAHKLHLDFLHYHPNDKLAEKVKARDDSLLFQVTGDYETKLARYGYVLANYPNTETAKKALELKAKLYLENKKYEDILQMQSLLPKDSKILQAAIDNQTMIFLQENNCNGVVGVLSRANKVHLGIHESLQAFECLYNQTAFQKAHELFSELHRHIKDGEEQLRWLYLESNTLFALGQNKEAIQAGRDVMDLAFAMGKPQYYDIGFKMFHAFYNDEATRHEAISLSKKMDKWFPTDRRILEIHFTLLNEAEHKKDPLAASTEAKTILALQDRIKEYDYSPYVNFIYINTLINENNYTEALKQLDRIKEFKMTTDDRQQRFYKIATINYTLKYMENSKKALDACVALGTTSAWGTLCNNALSLHNNGFE
ncbi:hypothetical protein LS80_002170 [Helicobacter trogontum]|uniref:DUF7494 domain-containing protein n=1 Tax=Helicobacter trogontum TaxID=50960 RepID=A0A4U8TH01_9HELI|nr:hypothetical protein LS80_002170 [Helicobacter trogontum]